jgi:hypothetical protein
VREHPEVIAQGHAHPGVAGVHTKKSSVFHFELKIPHHKPTVGNIMSPVSLEKFGENLPVTGIVALSQAAVGFGVGLLVADKIGETARQRAAIALIGAGAATILPLVAGIITQINNRPDSSRRMRQQLEGIRRSVGVNDLE